jgi:hypothetical protein
VDQQPVGPTGHVTDRHAHRRQLLTAHRIGIGRHRMSVAASSDSTFAVSGVRNVQSSRPTPKP